MEDSLSLDCDSGVVGTELEDPEEEEALDEEEEEEGRKAGTAGFTAIILCPHIIG